MNSQLFFDAIVAAAPHRVFFATVTTISAFLVGSIALLLRQQSLKRETWIRYFGAAFEVIGLQYLAPTFVGLEHLLAHGTETRSEQVVEGIVATIGSSLNNVLFLAAALILLRRKRPRLWLTLASIWAAGAAVMYYRELLAPWHRSLDASLSALSLGLLGYALFTNIKPRMRWWLASIALLGGALYGLLNVASALTPAVTQGDLWPVFKAALTKSLGHVEMTPQLRGIPAALLPTYAVDTSLMAIALILKLLLAGGAFPLILSALVVISPRIIGQRLAAASAHEGKSFTGEGLLKTIGQSLDADRVLLCFRLPGLSNPRLERREWRRTAAGSEQEDRKTIPVPGEDDDSPEGKVLATGESVEEHRARRDTGVPLPKRRRRSFIAVPIQQYGSTTGCLRVEWHSAFSFTATAVQQAKRLADLLAPMLEERRQMAALDRWGRRSRGLSLGMTSELDTQALTYLVFDTLAPLAVGIHYTVGFQPAWAIASDRGRFSGAVGNLSTADFLGRVREQAGGVEPVATELSVKEVAIGALLIAWPSPEGARQRPVVFSDDLHRQTMAALIASSMFDAAELGLAKLLGGLQIQLSSREVETREQWFAAIERAALEAGLLWVVALTGDRFLGSPPSLGEVASLLERRPELRVQERPLQLSLGGDDLSAPKLVVLRLPLSQTLLWLGIDNDSFEPELGENWPWSDFLERLAAAADSVLARITSHEEFSRVQREAAELASMLAAGADSIGFIHEIRNLARNFQTAAQSLDEAHKFGLLQAPKSVTTNISGLHDSAQRLFEMSQAIMASRPSDPRSAYPLIDPIKGVQDLMTPMLAHHRIDLEVAVEPGLVIAFPFHLAYQALVSLLCNSIEAIEEEGKIQIVAEDVGDRIDCHIIDDGPGVSSAISDAVFDLGVTTKGQTGGKGLYLVRSLLKDHGGAARLTESRQGRTIFTLEFPKTIEAKGSQYEAQESAHHRG